MIDQIDDRKHWKEIAFAPRDGTRILVIFENNEASIEAMYWHKETTEWRRFGDDEGWREDDKCPPTHWMPLPEPPSLHR